MTSRRTFAVRMISARRRASIEAIRAEAESAADEATARRWRAAARWMLLRALLCGPLLTVLVTAAAIAAVADMNESGSDVASQSTLACLVVGAAVAGALARRPWVPGVLLGVTVAAEHVVAMALRLQEPLMHLPPGWLGTTSLLLLVLPAVFAAYAGSVCGRLLWP